MQAAASSALCGQPVQVQRRQLAGSKTAGRQQVLVQAAAGNGFVVPPAWPGRVPVPETLAHHDGPKVHLLQPLMSLCLL